MQLKLLDKTIPNEPKYVIELGESQLRNLHTCLMRNRLNVDNPDRLNYELLEKEIKDILNASSIN